MNIRLYGTHHEITTNPKLPHIRMDEVAGGYRWIERTLLSSEANPATVNHLEQTATRANNLLDRIHGQAYEIDERGTIDLLKPKKGFFLPAYLVSAGNLDDFAEFLLGENINHCFHLRSLGRNHWNTPSHEVTHITMGRDYFGDAHEVLPKKKYPILPVTKIRELLQS